VNAPSSIAIAVALVLAVPAAAGAQAPASGDFGGGTLNEDPYRNATKTMTIAASVSGGQARIQAFVTGRCATALVRRTVPITPEGDFSLQVSGRRRNVAGFRSTHRLTLRGRITPEGGSGTASARLTGRARGRRLQRCSTGALAWAMKPSGLPGQGNPSPAPAGATLLGTSAQRLSGVAQPVLLRVSTNRQRLEAGIFGFGAPCQRKAVKWDFARFGWNVIQPATINPDGSFRSQERFRNRYRDSIERATIVFEGRFVEGGAQGTLSLTSRWTTRKGRFLDRCTTGTHAWTARL